MREQEERSVHWNYHFYVLRNCTCLSVSKLEPSRALVAAENTFKQQHHCCRFFPCKGFVEGLPKGTNEYCCCIFVVTKQEKKIDVTSNNSSWGTEELFIYWILSYSKGPSNRKGTKAHQSSHIQGLHSHMFPSPEWKHVSCLLQVHPSLAQSLITLLYIPGNGKWQQGLLSHAWKLLNQQEGDSTSLISVSDYKVTAGFMTNWQKTWDKRNCKIPWQSTRAKTTYSIKQNVGGFEITVYNRLDCFMEKSKPLCSAQCNLHPGCPR